MFHLMRYKLGEGAFRIPDHFRDGSPRRGDSVDQSEWCHRTWVNDDGVLIYFDYNIGSPDSWSIGKNFMLCMDDVWYSFTGFSDLLAGLTDTLRRAQLVHWYYHVIDELLCYGLLTEDHDNSCVVQKVVKVDLLDKTTSLGDHVWVSLWGCSAGGIYPGRGVGVRLGSCLHMGVVSTNVISGDGLEEMLLTVDPQFPRVRLEFLVLKYPLKGLVVPNPMIYSEVSEDILEERRREYKANGAFSTRVLVDDDNELLDGYSAYLVAKELGLFHIPYLSPVSPFVIVY